MKIHQKMEQKGRNDMPDAVRNWRWWAGVKDKYFAQIGKYADGFGRASAFPDKGMLSKVRVFDTTARDGMQAPDAFLTEERGISVMQNKVDICIELAKWGIPMIEAGNAVSSLEEKNAIRAAKQAVSDLGLKTEIVSLARTKKKDIDEAHDSDADIVHIFSSGSIPHAWVKFGKTPEELIPDIVECVEYAKDIGFRKIVFSLEDAVRSDPKHLVEIAKRIYAICGKDVHYNIPDTIGAASPVQMFSLISYIRSQVPIALQVHCHNDMGRAEENTLAAIYAGVSEIQTTMHGMGERAGNAALERIAINLYANHGVEIVDLKQIARISEFIRERSGIKPAANASIVGKNAFWHESGVHGDAVFKSELMGYSQRKGMDGGSIYTAFNPSVVGRKEEVGVGPLCGQKNVIYRLREFGITVPDEKVADIVAKVKSMAAMSRVSDADFILMAYETVKGMPCERVKIDKEEICTGTDGSRAHVKLKLNGHYGEGNGTGNGPVDAAVNAIREAMVRWTKVEISSYSSNALGKGSNAAARISMSIRKGNQEIEASAFGTDIVTASIDAFAKGYNAMCALEELQCIGK